MPYNVCGPFAINFLPKVRNCVHGSIHHKNGQSASFCFYCVKYLKFRKKKKKKKKQNKTKHPANRRRKIK
jgi:hypothetical protein